MNNVVIKSFKANGKIHRSWYSSFLVKENDEYLITASERTLVMEHNGRTWVATEPSVNVFFKNEWYNVLAIFKEDSVYFYVNLASPSICEDNVIKYVDYDLDIKFRDEVIKVLDENEYKYNSKRMQYDSRIDPILTKQSEKIKELMREHKFPFDEQKLTEILEEFRKSR